MIAHFGVRDVYSGSGLNVTVTKNSMGGGFLRLHAARIHSLFYS